MLWKNCLALSIVALKKPNKTITKDSSVQPTDDVTWDKYGSDTPEGFSKVPYKNGFEDLLPIIFD